MTIPGNFNIDRPTPAIPFAQIDPDTRYPGRIARTQGLDVMASPSVQREAQEAVVLWAWRGRDARTSQLLIFVKAVIIEEYIFGDPCDINLPTSAKDKNADWHFINSPRCATFKSEPNADGSVGPHPKPGQIAKVSYKYHQDKASGDQGIFHGVIPNLKLDCRERAKAKDKFKPGKVEDTFATTPKPLTKAPDGSAKVKLLPLIEKAATDFNLPRELIAAIIYTETGGTWNKNAFSPKGARGLMQLLPIGAADVGLCDDLFPSPAATETGYSLRKLQNFYGEETKETVKELHTKCLERLYDPHINVMAGAKLMNKINTKYTKGHKAERDWENELIVYNLGLGKFRKKEFKLEKLSELVQSKLRAYLDKTFEAMENYTKKWPGSGKYAIPEFPVEK